MFSPDGTITGGAQTGLTSPTYDVASDVTAQPNSRQYYVSAAGGTQTGVRTHSAGDPFTLTIRKDAVYKTVPAKNPVSGAYPNIPLNAIELLIRKGFKIDTAGTIKTGFIRVKLEIPAGSESNDAVNIRAACSFLVGLLSEESADLGDSAVAGII